MNILLVGALSWNPERFISMCERGHKLYGLWTRTMAWEQGPYRLSTYVLAGLPIISEQMPGYYRYDILREHGIQIDLDDYDGLQKGLKDKGFLLNKSESVKSCRNKFSFDYSIDDLIGYFERIRTIYHSRPASEKKRVFTNNSTRYRNLLCRYSRLKTLLFDQTLSILLLPKRKYIPSLIQKDVRMKHYK